MNATKPLPSTSVMHGQQLWPDLRRLAAMPFRDAIEFAALDCSPGFARDRAVAVLNAWGLGDLEYPVTMIVSELVTNSVQATEAAKWTGMAGVVRIWMYGGPLPLGIYVLVHDAVVILPEWRDASEVDDMAESGRGLSMVVPALSAACGSYLAAHLPGKVTWALITSGG